MAEILRSSESSLFDSEKTQAAFNVLHELTKSKIDMLPPETHDMVFSVSFQPLRMGRPLNHDSSLSKVTVQQVYDPWLLVEFEDMIGERRIGYLFHETGNVTRLGDFNPYSEKPAIELVKEFVDSIDFYEKLLMSDACVSEIALRV